MNVKDLLGDENERPLDRLVTDGGFFGIFRTVACVGDSLSSGEFEGTNDKGEKTYHDFYDYSWGQYIARMAGCKVYNFSRGGMTAKVYCDSFAEENGFWNADKAAQAYIIAMGLNDLGGAKHVPGSIDDVCLADYNKNGDTVYGNYAKIVQRYKEIQPDAKFFFVTFPSDGQDEKKSEFHRNMLYKLAEVFDNCYVIDLMTYGPKYDSEFKRNFYLGGHLNACGYMLTAKLISSYIDYIIRHNLEDFKQIGFIGTPYKNTVCN